MAFLLDTDLLIDHFDGEPTAMMLVASMANEGLAISAITYMEAFEGILRHLEATTAERHMEALLIGVAIISIDEPVARRCAQLRWWLRRQGRRVGSRAIDLLIAATAIEHDLVLATRNLRDYRDIPGLVLRSS
jgi:tRNA(fMet)-specific endonuclease VapC